MWTGFCRVMMLGSDTCKILLVNEDNTVFAESSFKNENWEQYIQRCMDSSRFFAVLLVNPTTGQKANIGVQFPERNDSFDFIGAFDQYRKYYRDMKGTDTDKQEFQKRKLQDFSLKQGKKITVNIKGVTGTSAAHPKKGFGGGLKKLGKPPGQNN